MQQADICEHLQAFQDIGRRQHSSSATEILAHLEKTGGRSYHAQYVNKLTSKLKDRLREGDLDIPIVSGKLGVRVLVAAGCVELVQLNTMPTHKRGSGAP